MFSTTDIHRTLSGRWIRIRDRLEEEIIKIIKFIFPEFFCHLSLLFFPLFCALESLPPLSICFRVARTFTVSLLHTAISSYQCFCGGEGHSLPHLCWTYDQKPIGNM